MLSNKIKKGDIAIITAVLCIAVVLFAGINIRTLLQKDSANVVVIKETNERESIYPLEADNEFFVGSNGYTLEIKIKNGEVRVVSSDCPDHSCVRMGAIGKGGRNFIACVPAGVYLTCGEGIGDGPDAVVG